MLIYIAIISLLFFAYIIVMLGYSITWQALPSVELEHDFQPTTHISVLIAARNEAKQIQETLRNILLQSYPKDLFEIIVIDDHSEDETIALIEAMNLKQVQLLKLEELVDAQDQILSYKKKAIEEGIKVAKGELIVCTDADCNVPPNWLHLIAQVYEQEDAQFIAAPVEFSPTNNLFERFQALDFLGMMAITGAGIYGRFMRMCNGANLAYPKAVFEEVNGFDGINHLASGDDMLLLQKIAARHPKGIRFLKSLEALVTTTPKTTLQSFMQQRIRWASKSSAYKDWRTQLQLGVVWLFCWLLLINLLLTFLNEVFIFIFLVQLLLKAVIEYRLLFLATSFFQRRKLLGVFWPSLFLHTLYIVVVGTISLFPKKYEWKGRKIG